MLQPARVPHFWLLLFLLAVLILTSAGRLAPMDDETSLEMTANLIERGQLSIDRQTIIQDVQPYPGFLPHARPREMITTWAATGRDGQLYAEYSYGTAVLNAPLYLIGRVLTGGEISLRSIAFLRWLMSMLDPIAIAVTGWLIALLAGRLGYSTRLSVGLALAYSFGTFAFAYTHTFFSEPFLGLLIACALYALVRYRLADSRAVRWIVVAGCTLGFAVYIRERSAVMLPPFFAYIFVARLRWRIREWIIFLVPTLLAGGLILLANNLRFGSPFTFAYGELQNASFTNPIGLGLYGLLISSGKGVLWYAPLTALGLAGFFTLARRRSPEAVLYATTFILEIIFFSLFVVWTGGWNWGPRYLLPVLPFLILSAGAWLHAKPVPMRRVIFSALCAIGFFINLSAVVVDHSRYLTAFSEIDPDQFYNRSIIQPSVSPLIQQWPAAIEVIGLALKPDSWSAAQRAIDDHLQAYSGPNEIVPISIHLMWVDEFFRLNLPDFWWLHLPMLGFSPIVIGLLVILLLVTAFVSGRKVIQGLRAEG